MGALKLRQRIRHLAARGQHARSVKCADGQGVRRRICRAHHHHLGIAALNRAHCQVERHPERGAGRHRREHQAGNLSQDRHLRSGRVVDVPNHVRRDFPGRFRALPLLLQANVQPAALPQDVEFAILDLARKGQPFDLVGLREVLPELRRFGRPECIPLGATRLTGRLVSIAHPVFRACEERTERGIVFRLRPERVPLRL